MGNKKYYWLKLKDDFFRGKEIKKLRRIAGGDTYTIIYLKMMLSSLRTNGVIYYDGIEDCFADEIALDLDEDVENVKVTLRYLEKEGLLTELSESEIQLIKVSEYVGSETDKATFMRRRREAEKLSNEAQSNNVTQQSNNVTLESNNVTQHSNNVTRELPSVTFCYTEIEKEIETDTELELEEEVDAHARASTSPTLDDVDSFCRENGLHLDTKKFFYYYSGQGWKDKYGNSIDWKSKAASWSSTEFPNKTQHTSGASATPKPSNGRYSGVPGKAEFDAVRRRNGIQ